ncbi:MAG: sodium/proton antiporter, family [Candidatus Eremiobacteraeota bacterium]|nr:sodium/proton antiporter, family [Candidatus Eremiobacteraeota bacterium]
MNAVASGVGGFIALLGAAVVIAILAQRLRVPAAVALVAVGAFVQLPPPFEFGDTLLFVFLPPLIFEAAWNLDPGALRRTAWRIAALAVPGTLLTAFAIAGGLLTFGVLPFNEALLFGAIVAATDPVAVVSAFRNVPVPLDLKTLVEGESLANDGVALVLFGFALALATGGATSIAGDVASGVIDVAGGSLVGVVAALICAAVLRATNAAEYEVTITIVLAYGSYVVASALGWSGIFATAAGAIALRVALARLPTSIENAEEVDRVWSAVAFIANAAVFLATGLLIQPQRIAHEPVLMVAAVGLVWLTRAVLALIAMRDRAGRITVFLAGMRGALPLALALSLPDSLVFRPQIIDATFAVVLVTIVAQGVPLEMILSRLYRNSKPVAEHT